MSTKDTGGAAFPIVVGDGDQMTEGMTLRDYFAAKAVQGLLSDSNIAASTKEFAERAYEVADAMLKARNES
jgi:hypothetical protein